MLKKLFSHTAIYGLAPQVTKLATIFALPLITSELTALDYGVGAVVGGYTGAIGVFAVLGIRIVLVNTFYKNNARFEILWRQIFGFLNLWSIVYAIIIAGLLSVVIPDVAAENKWAIIGLNIAPFLVFGRTSLIASTYYQLKQKPLQIAIRTIVFGLLTIGLNVLFIKHYQMGYMGFFYSGFIAEVLRNFSYFIPLYFTLKIRPIYHFKWRFIKNSLKVSIPLIPHYYSVYLLSNSDKVVLDALGTSTLDMGRYEGANTFGNGVGSVNSAIGTAVGPLITECYSKKDYLGARRLIFTLQIGVLSLFFLVSIWLKEVFAFFIKNELSEMYYLGIILIMAYTYRPMYLGFGSKYMYFEKTKTLFKVTFFAGLLNVGLNLLLIPYFGFEVAAITTFVGYMYMGYFGYTLKSFREINTVPYYPLLWLLATVGLTLGAYYAVELPVLPKLTLTSVFLAIAALAGYQLILKKQQK